jgi:hypothetical protein
MAGTLLMGKITSYSLPSAITLPAPQPQQGDDIAARASKTVWFTAKTTAGKAAVGEISGLS